MKKPYYILKFSAVQCRFEIKVNDRLILQMNVDNGQVTSQVPINHAIAESGTSEITVSVIPVIGSAQFSKETSFNYDCLLFDVSNGFQLQETYEGYKSPKITDAQPLSTFASTQTLNVNVSYKLNTLWEEGKKLDDIEHIEEKIRAAYLEIGDIILDKKYDVFKQKLSHREQNIATSMYLSAVDSRARLNGLIHDFENGFDILDLAEDAIIVYSANKKIASLRRLTGEPALCFKKEKPMEQLMLDIEFYWSEESQKFEII
ncbi:hypothetical protein HN014_08900 [Aquimarina sp. TRL1]|uniref:hypothetical protein n=1 Tax=Aquimarina sp. (strain TRL1) TaxID=2736252 RepID=UPI00158EFC35|nr:hypothetical protein [Aquimarina sp. TRL1]QKX05028.1 hypothetical protein HN014_08900 [Aquimarina sp. TRL1]